MRRVERLFHIIAFVIQCGGIVPLLLRTGDDSADLGAANPLNTIATCDRALPATHAYWLAGGGDKAFAAKKATRDASASAHDQLGI